MNTNQATHRRHSREFLDTARQHASRSDDGNAFLRDPESGPARALDDLAEESAESFIQSATSGQDADEEVTDAEETEELGGPFVETTMEQELALDTDASNPRDAEPAPFPSAHRTL